MVKIDTSEWREFEIGKLFEISRPITRSQAKYSDGDIPFVASGNFSNGVVRYCEPKKGEVLDERNCITVSPLDGSAFYQPDDFLGRGGAGSAILMLRNNRLNENNGLFVATVIRASLTKYTYSNQLNSQTIASENIILPVDSHGSPDWAYMDSFMAEVMKESETCLENLRLADEKKESVDLSSWKEFSLSEIGFSNYHGQRLNKAQRIDGNIPFVTAGFENRGISQYIGNDRPVYEKAITIDMFGNCFFQSVPCAGDDNVYFFVNNAISDNAKLFISVCIQAKILTKYAYVRQFRQPDADNLVVALPADLYGYPDWAYMDSYMQDLMYETKQRIDVLTKTISQD